MHEYKKDSPTKTRIIPLKDELHSSTKSELTASRLKDKKDAK